MDLFWHPNALDLKSALLIISHSHRHTMNILQGVYLRNDRSIGEVRGFFRSYHNDLCKNKTSKYEKRKRYEMITWIYPH